MVVDTSAVIAMIFHEDERRVFADLLAVAAELVVPALVLHEASIVTAAKKQDPSAALLVDDFISDLDIGVAPLDAQGAIEAREAYFRFGRGYHAARLNLTDCVCYALARRRDDTLLFKGDDFAKTDVVAAWRP